MSWRERFSSKMNRSSWKIAHEDPHPHVEDMNDLQLHLTSHHEGDFIGDTEDHEWFHTDPSDYIETHRGFRFPIKPHNPDHYHTNDYERSNIPDALPQSFASFNKLGELCPSCNQEFPHKDTCILKHYLNSPERVDKTVQINRENQNSFWEDKIKDSDPSPSYWEDKFKNSMKKIADPGSLRGEGISGMIDPDEEVVGPEDLDSNATVVDKFPKSVGVFNNGSKITSSWNTKTADDIGQSEFGNPIDYNENRMQSVEAPGLEIKTPLDTGKRNYTEQRQDANPLTLRSWYTGDDVNGPWPHTKNLSGPLDFEPTDDQNKDSTGPIMGSFNSKTSHFEDVKHPFLTEDNIREHIETHHFGENPTGDDYLKQTFRERLPLSNNELLREHLTFHNDVRGENPLVGGSSWVLPHEHGDNPTVNVPDDLSGFNPRSAHFEDIAHPWPDTNNKLADHLESHHPKMIKLNADYHNIPESKVLDHVRKGHGGAFKAHMDTHKNKVNNIVIEDDKHEHDDDNLGIDIPDNIETIEPAYVTSSWHQSNVKVFDTHPDEESPDTLLNPADELKNGRPRANDLPNQSAQLIPGMLMDHDQMGGSGTDSGSF